MPRGPKGEKRPADVIGNAVHVMRIAPGEIGMIRRSPMRPRQWSEGPGELADAPETEHYPVSPSVVPDPRNA